MNATRGHGSPSHICRRSLLLIRALPPRVWKAVALVMMVPSLVWYHTRPDQDVELCTVFLSVEEIRIERNVMMNEINDLNSTNITYLFTRTRREKAMHQRDLM